MFIATKARQHAQRTVCLLLSLLIVSASLTLGAVGIESMVDNAAQTAQPAGVRA